MNLDAKLAAVRQRTEQWLAVLQKAAHMAISDMEAELKLIVQANGFRWCDACEGTGAIARLDAGYMRRFGLREWNGCENCGGDGERRGKGYIRSS